MDIVYDDSMEPIIAHDGDSEHESHEGTGSYQGKGGNGQGGSKNGYGGTGSSDDEVSLSEQASSGGSGSGGSGRGSGSGSSGGSTGSGGGKPIETGGTKQLDVTVLWPDNTEPRDVKVTLSNGETSQTKTTTDSKVTFFTEPGDEWELTGEPVPGFEEAKEGVAIKGTDVVVTAELEYVAGDIAPNNILLNKTTLTLFEGDTVTLSATVLPKNASDDSVTWTSSSTDIATVSDSGVIEAIGEGTATITATSIKADVTATCEVTVLPLNEVTVRVEGITLEENQVNLDLGNSNNTYELNATVSPSDATVKDVLWTSDDANVATVDQEGIVTAKSQGFTIITAETVDGGFYAFAHVSVGAAPEAVYIYPYEQGSDDEHFSSLDKIFINVEGLVQKLLDDGQFSEVNNITYYVKVTEKGSTEPLGSGTVNITSDSVSFNLMEVTNFIETDNNSARYFVYMSRFEDFPKDDEKTLMTNFMGGSATPTIPLENINVSVTMRGGERSAEGIYVILAREEYGEGITLEEVSWKHFCQTEPPSDPYAENISDEDIKDYFIDEVKLIGKTNEYGVVNWFEPKETMKLGGYLLLEITPNDYKDNLNMVNPASDDYVLLKQVTLMRDGGLNIEISNIYVGESSNDNPVKPPVTPPVDDNPPVNPPVDDNPPVNPPIGGSNNTNADNMSKAPSAEEFINIETTDKFNGHWAKKFIDNIIQKKKMPKSIYESILDLNNEVYLSDLIELDSFINEPHMYDSSKIENLDLPVTRQQAIVMIMTSFGFSAEDEPLDFIDQNEIAANAKGFIATACRLGIISGYPDNSFRPNNTLTKAELFTIISKCLDIKYPETMD